MVNDIAKPYPSVTLHEKFSVKWSSEAAKKKIPTFLFLPPATSNNQESASQKIVITMGRIKKKGQSLAFVSFLKPQFSFFYQFVTVFADKLLKRNRYLRECKELHN